jgi:hypothetical protein
MQSERVMGRPGDDVPEVSEGITRVEDISRPRVQHRSRCYRHRRWPRCDGSAPRCNQGRRTLHDLGYVHTGRPFDIMVYDSKEQAGNKFR